MNGRVKRPAYYMPSDFITTAESAKLDIAVYAIHQLHMEQLPEIR